MLCWGEGHGSAIHDHTDSHCFVKMLEGELKETMFEWPSSSEEETEMTLVEKNIYGKNGVTYINGMVLFYFFSYKNLFINKRLL